MRTSILSDFWRPALHRAAAAAGVREIWQRDDGCLDFVCAGGSVVRLGAAEVEELIPERWANRPPVLAIDPAAMRAADSIEVKTRWRYTHLEEAEI